MKLFVAGDVIMTTPWSKDPAPEFLRLIDLIRATDASIANLEIPLNDGAGYPQIDSGGIHMTGPGDVATQRHYA